MCFCCFFFISCDSIFAQELVEYPRMLLSWPWSYGSWIYNYLCDPCLSPLMLWVRITIRARSTLCDKVCQWLATCLLRILRFPPPIKLSATIFTEILLKVALNTIKPTNQLTIHIYTQTRTDIFFYHHSLQLIFVLLNSYNMSKKHILPYFQIHRSYPKKNIMTPFQ